MDVDKKPLERAQKRQKTKMVDWRDSKEARPEMEKFVAGYIKDFVDYIKTTYEWPDSGVERLTRMLKYTVPGGKYNRGLLCLWTGIDICRMKGMDFASVEKKCIVLAWCVEILQACFLVSDDVMDSSITRRGKPCWYKVPGVGLDAVNDSLILESLLFWLIEKNFEGKQYTALMKLFHDVSLKTQMGQMLDTMSEKAKGQKGIFEKFTMKYYTRIITYKTAYYSFYLPAASALIACGIIEENVLKATSDICVALGVKFQIQDDFLDCYGDPKHIGKVGTDIFDHKCTWLLVIALGLMNADQRKTLEANYGMGGENEEAEKKVKELYKSLKLEEVYEKQEADSYAQCAKLIQQHSKILPEETFVRILKKIHKRTK
eukprot:CAMPEP_0167759900 /NCGR_PEP_ID=MMETSP0110_2-20121227/11281_1 /TAXON_ID=629695 /ORGANISM="Gymnochlora sp., Strain CCMP2014" /LENGTH=373 /DNA_ID=CAMNT_0007646339 /DNA_START=34 /DNA_END=1155 /DNA_ORIENTATION=-